MVVGIYYSMCLFSSAFGFCTSDKRDGYAFVPHFGLKVRDLHGRKEGNCNNSDDYNAPFFILSSEIDTSI